jgi:sugar transferase (PEP-CTERM/EpsH1 system associated)
LLKHLAARHRVFLGTFIDDPQDAEHVETVKSMCAGAHVARLDPRLAKLLSLKGLTRREPLTLPYYADRSLRDWVRRTVVEQGIGTAVVFSSAMAQYVRGILDLRVLLDLVDVDSAKWAQYAKEHRWPLSWLYEREGRLLLDYERTMATQAARTFLVTDAEVELFCRLAPECADRVEAMANGVDADYFSPAHSLASPYAEGEVPVVFTGAMDYWPNIDAVCWFASEILPRLKNRRPQVRFYIVGMRPSSAVQALAGDAVVVTGTVPDVRPYLKHAYVVVAPLRVARGIQNKMLEAMAMAKAVVGSQGCSQGIDAEAGRDFEMAADAKQFADRIEALLSDPACASAMGQAARERVLSRYSWDAHLSRIDAHIEGSAAARPHNLRRRVPSPLVGEGQGEGEPAREPAPSTLSPTPLPSRERGVLSAARPLPMRTADEPSRKSCESAVRLHGLRQRVPSPIEGEGSSECCSPVAHGNSRRAFSDCGHHPRLNAHDA